MDKFLILEKKIKELKEEIKDLKESMEELIYLFVEHNENEEGTNYEHKGISLSENEEEAIEKFKLFCNIASKEEVEKYIKRLIYTATKIFPKYDKLNEKKIERLKKIREILKV